LGFATAGFELAYHADEQTRFAVMVIVKMPEHIKPRFSRYIGID